MTRDELALNARRLVDDLAEVAPGHRHVHLSRLHSVMGDYARSGHAAPKSLRRLLDEITEEAVHAQF